MSLEVITGCMYSGKSSELLRRVRLSQIAGLNCVSFKHALDVRYAEMQIVTHPTLGDTQAGGWRGACVPVQSAGDLETAIFEAIDKGAQLISIDEIQFFPLAALDVLFSVIDHTKVIVAGLNRDAYGVPFEIMPGLLAEADKIKLLYAVCTNKKKEHICGAQATHTLALTPRPAGEAPTKPVISVGSYGKYAARCRSCWVNQAT
jgi:thymidine kinase